MHSVHRYQLGELNNWRKNHATELSNRVPLILRAPWFQPAGVGGTRTDDIFELIDLLPTVVSLAGAPPVSTEPTAVGRDHGSPRFTSVCLGELYL